MATEPNKFRDPKVTGDTAAGSSAGIGKWIAIAVGVLLLLLLLAWLFGLFADDEVDAAVVEGGVVTTEEVDVVPVQ